LGDLVLAQIARDEIRLGTLALPPVFEDNLDLLSRVSSVGYAVTRTILTSISSALKLSPATLLENHHRDDEPSNTGLKLYYEPAKERVAEVAENWHTDGGTLTLLFCDQWGLYMEEPASKKGGFILPVPGCAIVNVADSLQRLSGGRLHSCRHQVIQPVDGFQKRYFVVYFLRPEV
jgi:isopenicillin N synthase-like dioxygenase